MLKGTVVYVSDMAHGSLVKGMLLLPYHVKIPLLIENGFKYRTLYKNDIYTECMYYLLKS